MKRLGFLLLLLLLSACTTTSHFSAVQDGVEIAIGKTAVSGSLPLDATLNRTTFGRYPVKAVKQGYQPIYGNLPLKVSGGIIFLDALLFAPAVFFNVQGSIPFYEIDMEKGTIRYRQDENGPWINYPIAADQQRAAKTFFGD